MAISSSSSSGNGGSSCSSSSGSKQILLLELKHRILSALNKLADRDTQHLAVEDLERIAQTLSPQGISLCLTCLYDTDSQHKSAVRKECVKLFGTLASLHDDLLAPHLPKIVLHVVRRLRDPDSSIRDSCVEAMGTLAGKVLPAGAANGGGDTAAPFAGPLGVFAKPLFDALSEQNRGVQVGAAMCLAAVIDNFSDPRPGSLQRLCPRIIKLLNSSTFNAKAALLAVVASIVQAGGATSYQCLATLITCVQDCLKSNDWATRKAASETLARMASSVGPSLATFKLSVLEALEACRFDKVKPVRETVVQTMPVWEKIPSSEMVPDRNSAVKDNDFMENYDCHLSVRKVEGFKEGADVLKRTSEVNSSSQPLDTSYEFGHARSTVNKIKERAPLTDKIANPDFFQKLEKKDAHDWQIDIALPASVQGSSKFNVPKSQPTLASKETNTSQEHNSLGESISHGNIGFAKDRIQNSSIVIENQIFEENVGLSCAKTKRSRSKITEPDPWFDPALQQQEDGAVRQWTVGPGLGSTSSNSSTSCHSANSGNDLAFIRRQICQLESQQLDLVELLQKFMSSSQESFLGLEARVAGVENILGNLVRNLTDVRCESSMPRCCGKLLAGADFFSSKFWKKNENRGYAQDRSILLDSTSIGKGAGDPPYRNPQSSIAGYDESRAGIAAHSPLTGNPCLETQDNFWRVHVDVSSDSAQRRMRNDAESNQQVNKKVQERGAGTSRLGEGPSARSIWQASKDEATLAAIRVAGEDARMKVPENLKTTVGSRSEGLSNNVGRQGRGPFWSLWKRAAECLRSGDVNSAYVEVLCAGDELVLVRLMSRTGPVLEQLSSGTTQELLRTIIQLLSQQSFLDVILPWIQQLADAVTSIGPDCVGLSLDAKRKLVASLEEASSCDCPEIWISKALDNLAIQLGTSWGQAAGDLS